MSQSTPSARLRSSHKEPAVRPEGRQNFKASQSSPSPKKAPRKRAAAPASAPPGSAKKQKRGSGRAPATYNEDALAEGGVPSAAEKALFDERAFWSNFSTPLNLSWILDYGGNGLEKKHYRDRSVILDTLVIKHPPHPGGTTLKAQLATMQANFEEMNPAFEGETPGLEPVTPDPSDEDEDVDMTAQTAPPPAASSQAAADERSAQRKLFPDKDPASSIFSSDPGTPKKSGGTAGGKLLDKDFSDKTSDLWVDCKSCLAERPIDAYAKERWVCLNCHRRGDLEANDDRNVRLRADWLALRATIKSGNSSGDSTGQSHAAELATARDAGISALDRSYIRLAERGAPCPIFTGPRAGAPLSHGEALAESRKAQGASATQAPSEHLIALIRSGKLTAISHAVPRPLSGGATDENQTFQTTADGSLVLRTKEVDIPQNLGSLQQFCKAMFSTIIPALIDRPAALMQWVALGRSALELHERFDYDWTLAAAYMTQLLNERVPQALPFAEMSQACLQTVMMARLIRNGGPSRGDPRPSGPGNQNPHNRGEIRKEESAGDPRAYNACRNWNNGYCGYQGCRNSHVCFICKGAHRAGQKLDRCRGVGSGEKSKGGAPAGKPAAPPAQKD